MSETPETKGLDRRELFRRGTLALLASGFLEPAFARLVHGAVASQRSAEAYEPGAFNRHEYATLRHLCDLILPADEVSAGALEAGAPEFIDTLSRHSEELARIFRSGILWLDHEMRERTGGPFLEAEEEAQHEMLGRLATAVEPRELSTDWEVGSEYAPFAEYTAEPVPEAAAGGSFFSWLRRLVVDAFYTSPVGMADLGYQGNTSMTEYTVPEETVRLAFARSPFRRP